MGGVIVLMGVLYSRGRAGATGRGPGGAPIVPGARLRQSVPAFVVGFLLMAFATTLGITSGAGAFLGRDLAHDLQAASRFLILVALAGVGLSTRVSAMRRTGAMPLLVGFATAATTAVSSYLLIRWLGPAGG